MSTSEEETLEELEHHRKLIQVLRRRLRDREIQAATYGIDVPPHVAAELDHLNVEIRTHQEEIARLNSQLAVFRSLDNANYSRRSKRRADNNYLIYIAIAGIVLLVLSVVIALASASVESQEKPNPITQPSSLTNISGEWSGTLILHNKKYKYNITLLQSGDANVYYGNSHSELESNSSNEADANVYGTYSNGVFDFQETKIIRDKPSGTGCLIGAKLRYNKSGGTEELRGNLTTLSTSKACSNLGQDPSMYLTRQK